jgi:peptidyl-prolyl cis-trans isomerase D
MFDLFRSREKSVRIVLGGVLVMVAASMLLYLVPSYNTGLSGKEAVVAEVGGDEITVTDVRKMVEMALKGRQLPPEILPNYIPSIVDEMVNDRALEYEASKLGFQVTDQDLAAAVRESLPPELFPNGKFAGKEAYAMVLAQRNMTIEEFEADIRRQVLIHRMVDVAIEGSVVSDLEIAETFKTRNEKIKIEYVKMVSDQFQKEVEPSLEDMQRFFTPNASQFQVPARRSLAVLYLDPAKAAESMKPSDSELEAAYNQNLDKYRVGERVKMRHILLLTQGKPASEEPKIKAQADDILRQVRGGAKFADLVEKYTEDLASKAKAPNREAGLGPGEYWVERTSEMVPEFKNAAFTLKPGQSDVIKTTYGYHVVQVLEHQDAHLKPFEEVKADISNQLTTQRANALVQTDTDQAEAALRANPTHPEAVAAELHMQLIRVDDFQPARPIPEIGPNPDFEHSVEYLKTGEVSQPVSLIGNRLALAVATGITPARQKTFEEAQAEVRARLVVARQTGALQKHAQEFYDKAKVNNDLEGVAKSMGLKVETTKEFSRSDNLTDVGLDTAAHFKDGFTLPVGSVYGPILLTSGTVIAKVIARVAPDMSGLPAERATIRDEIKTQKAKERYELFKAGVLSELERTKKIKRHKDVVDLLIASYLSKG